MLNGKQLLSSGPYMCGNKECRTGQLLPYILPHYAELSDSGAPPKKSRPGLCVIKCNNSRYAKFHTLSLLIILMRFIHAHRLRDFANEVIYWRNFRKILQLSPVPKKVGHSSPWAATTRRDKLLLMCN